MVELSYIDSLKPFHLSSLETHAYYINFSYILIDVEGIIVRLIEYLHVRHTKIQTLFFVSQKT